MKLVTVKRKITKDDIGKIAVFPYGRIDIDEFDKLKFGKCYTEIANFRTPAMVDLFEKWWSACALIADHHPEYKTREDVSDYILIKIGAVDYTMTTIKEGETLVKVKVKSISWARMNSNDFEEIYKKAEPVMCELLGCTPEELFDNTVFER